ncbi:MAG TPA: GPO family capsid scaffolding protein [Candidatus Sulfotelmatobacter sp.]|jgi:hypothetical protein|nr:GPO family capsid scaffolding protein [Candidatus Sulfotelmatobacter sp.]
MALTKFIRVAQSGPTIDGRDITPEQINQMAASYDPKKYGARIWLEHMRGYLPDSPFKAYGDVVAVKVADGDESGQRVLLAQIDPSPDLLKLNADRQKVFWSIEIAPDFAGTKQAYLAGLACTDSPASLGTEILQFAVKSEKAPDALKTHLFSQYIEGESLAATAADPAKEDSGLLKKITDLLSASKTTASKDDARLSQMEAGMVEIARSLQDLATGGRNFADAATVQKLSDDLAGVSQGLKTLTETLGQTETTPPRGKHSGGATTIQTDC